MDSVSTGATAAARAFGPGANHLPNRDIQQAPTSTSRPVFARPYADRRETAYQSLRPSSSPHTPPGAAPIYQRAAQVFAALITRTFGSALYPYPAQRSTWQKTLPAYISTVLVEASLPLPVGLSALILLLRYKAAVPHAVAYGDDAARLFLAAYIVAAKLAGAPYAPRDVRAWWRVGGGRFSCTELGRMERELCRVLKWDVLPDRATYVWLSGSVRAACDEGYARVRSGDDPWSEFGRGDPGTADDEGGAGADDPIIDIDDDDRTRARNYRLNPPPPPYDVAAYDAPVGEVPPYTVIRPAQGHTRADVEDRERLMHMLMAPTPPPPRTCMGSVRYGSVPSDAHRHIDPPASVSCTDMSGQQQQHRSGTGPGRALPGGAGVLEVLRERVLQFVLRRPGLPF